MALKAMSLQCVLGLSSLMWAAWADVDGCTSIAVGKKATVEGSAVVTHNNDCVTCDPRIVYIPARDHPYGSKRPIAPFRLNYPRFVGAERSETYKAVNGQNETVPIAFTNQVQHTYAYWEGAYPLVNEHGLGMGESTCAAKLVGVGKQAGGEALFTIAELMKIAMERCKDTRCAIDTMGILAVEHGFFGEDPGQGGAGESVSLSDKDETWVFHITSGLNGTSATWVAQRVPDEHLAITANNFIIQKVNCKDSANFMCSPNIFSNARDANLCSLDKEEDLNWLKCYAPDIRTFAYMPGYSPIPYYTTLRLWRIHSLATRSDSLPLTDEPAAFPFSVPAKEKLSLEEIMNYTRDYYKDTAYDMSKGIMSGWVGNPNRIEGGMGMHQIPGQFARGISIPRTSYSVVVQTKAAREQSVAWLASDQPMTSVFVPFFASAKRAAAPYQTGQQEVYSRDSAWWAFNFVSNWMNIHWSDMMARHVGPKMQQQQKIIMDAVKPLESDWPEHSEVLDELMIKLQEGLVGEWWAMADDLVVHYSDGHYTHKNGSIGGLGYPAWWLQMIGFNQDFYIDQWVQWAPTPPLLLGGPSAYSGLGLNSSLLQGFLLGVATAAIVVKACLPGRSIKSDPLLG